jgi:hypothetical protein
MWSFAATPNNLFFRFFCFVYFCLNKKLIFKTFISDFKSWFKSAPKLKPSPWGSYSWSKTNFSKVSLFWDNIHYSCNSIWTVLSSITQYTLSMQRTEYFSYLFLLSFTWVSFMYTNALWFFLFPFTKLRFWLGLIHVNLLGQNALLHQK